MGVAEPASFDTPSETIRTNHYQSESEGVFMGWAVAGGTAVPGYMWCPSVVFITGAPPQRHQTQSCLLSYVQQSHRVGSL